MRYIIVGAGSAGCVLAKRLTESGQHEVILVEAGPDFTSAELPSDLADGTRNSRLKHDWGYKHKVNSLQNVMFPFPRGRVVGGSSAVNTCIALRPQPYDINEWAERGLKDWTWDSCLPFLNRLERDLDFGDQPTHGASGELPIRRHPRDEWSAWQAAFVDSCESMGFASAPDGNVAGSTGAGPHAMNKLDGRRISVAESYLTEDVRLRSNLLIRANTMAWELVWDQTNPSRCLGVCVDGGQGPEDILGDEVLLALGAVSTPGLLLRSGVGPKGQLDELDVPMRVENAHVNAQLLDHPGFAMFFRRRWGAPGSTKDALIQTMCRTSGRFGNDLVMQPGSKWVSPRHSFPGFTLMAMLGKPKGTGKLIFKSRNPNTAPEIRSALLDHEDDRRLAVQTLQKLNEISQQPAMRELAAPVFPMQRVLKDADKLDGWIRKLSDSGYHPCGTIPMGEEGHAACDGQGRVYGTEGLRVVDASLMPTIPHANIHLTVIMVAERLAHFLLETN